MIESINDHQDVAGGHRTIVVHVCRIDRVLHQREIRRKEVSYFKRFYGKPTRGSTTMGPTVLVVRHACSPSM
jgi:hypothetical protein